VAAATLLLALLPSLWFLLSNRDLPHFGLLMDDAAYLSGARSLAEGKGYRLDVLPGSPAQTKYPPALSMLVAPLWMLTGSASATAGAAIPLLWLSMAVWILLSPWVFGRLGLSPREALAVAAFIAINPYVIFLSTCLLTEMPMLVLLWLAMRAAALAERQNSQPAAMLAGVAAGVAFLFRTAAAPMIAALLICFVLKGKHRLALSAAAAALPLAAGWLIWAELNRVQTADPQLVFYLDYTRHWVNHVAETGLLPLIQANLSALVISLGKLLWFDTGAWPHLVYARTAVLVAALAGSFALLRNGVSLLHLFSWGYAALILLWNFTPNERLALPLLPLLAAGVMEAGSRVARDARSFLLRPPLQAKASGSVLLLLLGSALAGMLAMGFTGLIRDMAAIPKRERERNALLAPAAEYARRQLGVSEPLLAFQEGRTAFQTGHPAIGLPLPTALGYGGDEGRVMQYFLSWPGVMRAHGIRHILLTPWDFELDLRPDQIRRYHRSVLDHPGVSVLYDGGGVFLVKLDPSR
jgi:hypothetical protein